MGNTILSDDAIGIIVVRYLREHLKNLPDTDFRETSWGGFRIIDLMLGYDYAVIIDSIKTGKHHTGYIHHLKTADLLHTLRLNSYHDINFMTAIKLAESLGGKMPKDIDILAVEVENNLTISENLSDEIRKSIYNCSMEVLDLLKDRKITDNNSEHADFETIDSAEELRKYYGEEIFEE